MLDHDDLPSIDESYWAGWRDGRNHVTHEVARVLLIQPDGIDNERLALLRSWAREQ